MGKTGPGRSGCRLQNFHKNVRNKILIQTCACISLQSSTSPGNRAIATEQGEGVGGFFLSAFFV